jgi:WD40 repeat protein
MARGGRGIRRHTDADGVIWLTNFPVDPNIDSTIRLWDMETQELRQTLIGHKGNVKAVAFSREGHMLATGSWDDTIRLWSLGR